MPRNPKTPPPTRLADNVEAKAEARNRRHRENICQLQCAATGAEPPNDPHHLKDHSLDSGGIGQKASDKELIPLCRAVHDEAHIYGGSKPDEYLVQTYGISPRDLAPRLWQKRGDLRAMDKMVWNHRQNARLFRQKASEASDG